MSDSEEPLVILAPEVVVVVHPIDQEAHPTYPPGYRWAVMVGGRPPTELDYCVNAGVERTESGASVVGESHGAAATKALRILGVPARYAYTRLGYDPIPPEGDQYPMGIWRGEEE